MKKFIFIEHTADMKFQAFGKTPAEAFKNACFALATIITNDKIEPKKKIVIKVIGKDLENLLYNFLEKFLFLIDTKNRILSECESVEIIQDNKGSCKLTGEFYFDDIKKYNTMTDIKAITYNNMSVRFDKEKNIWTLQVVVDV